MSTQDQDRQVLAALAQHGSNLTKTHRINHYFYFPNEAAAKMAARLLQQDGCTTEVRRAELPGLQRFFAKLKWPCFAQKEMVPEAQAVFATSARYEKIAAQCGGQYDGWEAPITK